MRARFPEVRFIFTAQLAGSLSDTNRKEPVRMDVRWEEEFNSHHRLNAVREVLCETMPGFTNNTSNPASRVVNSGNEFVIHDRHSLHYESTEERRKPQERPLGVH